MNTSTLKTKDELQGKYEAALAAYDRQDALLERITADAIGLGRSEKQLKSTAQYKRESRRHKMLAYRLDDVRRALEAASDRRHQRKVVSHQATQSHSSEYSAVLCAEGEVRFINFSPRKRMAQFTKKVDGKTVTFFAKQVGENFVDKTGGIVAPVAEYV